MKQRNIYKLPEREVDRFSSIMDMYSGYSSVSVYNTIGNSLEYLRELIALEKVGVCQRRR